jgi:hypothetical protein
MGDPETGGGTGGIEAGGTTGAVNEPVLPGIVSAAWTVNPVKCGSAATMEAVTGGIPDETAATFTVKQAPSGDTLDTVESEVRDDRSTANWASKKPSSEWGEDPDATFAVAVADATEESAGLSFHAYEDVPRETRSHARRPVGCAAFTGRYTIEFTDRAMLVRVKVKLRNKQAARPANRADYDTVADGPAVSDDQKRTMKRAIEGVLSRRLDLHRNDCARGDECDCPRENKCCRFEVVVRVFFVESGEYHTVNLWPGSDRHDVHNWHMVESRPGKSWAHETGHLLGWYDEYSNPGAGLAPADDNADNRWQSDRPRGIMGKGTVVYWDHLEDIRSWFCRKSSERWRLVAR